MTADEFWNLISESRVQTQSSDQQLEFLENYLKNAPDPIVEGFRRELNAVRATSNTFMLVFACGMLSPGLVCTKIEFEQFRSWIILQGRSVFEAVLADPDKLADLDPKFLPRTLQSIANAADECEQCPMLDEPATAEEYQAFLDSYPQLYPKLSKMQMVPHESDRDLITWLRMQQVDLHQATNIDHFMLCRSLSSAESLKLELQKRGYDSVSVNETKNIVAVQFAEFASPAKVSGLTHMLIELGRKFKCNYDGWGTST